MTTDEFEALLEAQAETQNLDFKAATLWDASRFARDILAFSNVQDGAIYQVTEIFEFISRLIRDEVYPDGLLVNLSLENTEGRELWIDDFNRMPFSFPRRTGAERIEIQRKIEVTDDMSDLADTALSVIAELFDHFGWENIPIESIRNDRAKFIAGSRDA